MLCGDGSGMDLLGDSAAEASGLSEAAMRLIAGSVAALTPKLAYAEQLSIKLDPKGLRVVGVSSDDPSKARQNVAEWKIPYAVGSDDGSMLQRAYQISAIPAVFLIDKKGVVRDVMVGYDPSRLAAFEKAIVAQLAK